MQKYKEFHINIISVLAVELQQSSSCCSGRYKSGITTNQEIFNARQNIFVRKMRTQWNCKLETSRFGQVPGCFYRNRCNVPVCYNRYYSTMFYVLPGTRNR